MKKNIAFRLAAVVGLLFSLGMAVRPGFEAGLPGAAAKGDTVDLETSRVVISSVAEKQNAIWDLAWGPDNWIWFTDQDGKLSRLNPETGEIKLLLQVKGYFRKRVGLMTFVLHPDWKKFKQVFVNYSHIDSDSVITAKLVRYNYRNGALTDPELLMEIPGYQGHNGARLVISADRKLLWATGDIVQEKKVLDPAYPNGKVLRLNLDGSIPADNPFPGSPVWCMGFRVPQGLVYTAKGNLFVAEHGDATDDEVNLLTRGGNYGWPYIAGTCDLPKEEAYCRDNHTIFPVKSWTPTIAPAGMDYYNGNISEWKNALLLTTLKTQSLRVLHLDASGTQIVSEDILFSKKFGRLRDVCVSPAGDVYIGTSNRDWNPPANFPLATDDKIIKIRRIGKVPAKDRKKAIAGENTTESGATIYASYCESCHKPDGRGVPGSFPSLVGSAKLSRSKEGFLSMVLNGGQAATGEAMPAFTFLSDRQLASLASYVRQQFAPELPELKESDFKAFRK
ncbi:PQQ-dependent sugar dehydrogenase [Ravibacter arvi]